jgi:phosphatidylinositol glycan class W
VNLPYILWVAAFNVSFLLGYLALDLAFRPSPESSARGTARSRTTTPVSPAPPVAMLPSTGAGAPPLLEALNRNSLIVFLLVRLPAWIPNSKCLLSCSQANVMTGIVNLTIRTLEASNLFAMSVLTLYSLVVCGVAWTFRNRRIWKM